MNNIDIIYYETVMDLVEENRKITDSLFNIKFANHFITESEIGIFESSIIESITKFINEVLAKVINFIKKVYEKITSKKIFHPNKQLIDAVKVKIKALNNDERKSFYLEKINNNEYINQQYDICEKAYNTTNENLKDIIHTINEFILYGKQHDPSDYNKVKLNVKNADKELDNIVDDKYIKSNLSNVDYNKLRDILDEYEKSDKTTKKLSDTLKKTTKDMKEHQRMMDINVINNKFDLSTSSRRDTKEYSLARDIIYDATNLIIKIQKSMIDLMILKFKNQQTILYQFIKFGPEVIDVK